ncbi:hypothetical protein H6F89_28900 [Cyanobacteria bacterium FACHB-63]|nr:hypothetical protein [Cyanobacteria bacterium FACHB-63]
MSKPKKPDPKRYLLPGGAYLNLERATAFVRFNGKYYLCSDVMISSARSSEEIESRYSDPYLDQIREPEVVAEAGYSDYD